MINNKLDLRKNIETTGLILILLFVLLHGIFKQDSVVAIISAMCGITYTFIAGKGFPVCYLFGLAGSGFYCYLAFQNSLWGNLLLYACYYIPMQVLGFFRWNNNLKQGKSEIVKISLSLKEMGILILLSILGIIITTLILVNFNDEHPLLDSITTIMSLGGMYLTVRRAIQQWLFWMVVNALSLVMWLVVAFSGARVWSTVLMWGVYLFLAVYFYINWKKELKINM